MHLYEIKRAIKAQLSAQLNSNLKLTNDLKAEFSSEILKLLKRAKVNADQEQKVARDLLDDLFGFGPIQSLLDDPRVTEIMVNGPMFIFVEVDGRIQETTISFDDELHLYEVVQKIARRAQVRIDESHPYADCVINGDTRVNLSIAPIAIGGPLITIRKPRIDIRDVQDLIRRKTLNENMYHFLWACVQARLNIMFSGATGTGKTTILEIFSAYIAENERMILIEDTPELRIRQKNVARLCVKPANIEGKGEITLRELFINSLRMRPNRILLGEIRGPEAFDYLQALTSGHRGSMAVIHAASAKEVGLRLENLAQLSGLNVPPTVLRQQIATGLDVIVQLERLENGERKITQITAVSKVLGAQDELQYEDLFIYDHLSSLASQPQIKGCHLSTGVIPKFFKEFEKAGVNVPSSIFSHNQA
jgi:pilus assembly protein CpaF